MPKEINRERLNELLKGVGGVEGIMKSLEQFRKDHLFLKEHMEEWRKQYPDNWVVVFQEELIGADKDYFKLKRLIDKKNIPQPYSVVIAFLSTKRIPMILLGQAAQSNCVAF
jgi:hypothetical protein